MKGVPLLRSTPLVAAGVAAGVAALTVLVAASASGQRGRVSPHESVGGAVDGATLTVTYGRPSMRGRTIFGTLVPYDRVWCPGADEATTLESDKPIRIGTLTIPPGPHTIWMLPTAQTWMLVVSQEPSGFHTRYNADADLGRVPMEKRALPAPIEQLTFSIAKRPSGGGAIAMAWETTEVSAPFSVVQ